MNNIAYHETKTSLDILQITAEIFFHYWTYRESREFSNGESTELSSPEQTVSTVASDRGLNGIQNPF